MKLTEFAKVGHWPTLLAAFVYMQMFVMPGKKGPLGMGPVG